MNIPLTLLLSGGISFVVTVILSLIIIPYLRKLKIGQVVRTDGPEEHLKKSGTPTMGGIMMLIVMIGILAIFAFEYPVLLLAIVLILGYGIVGFIDDRKKLVEKSSDGISAKMKMILLFVFSVLFLVLYMVFLDWGTGTNIPFLDWAGVFVVFTMLVMLGTSNAINLTDGLDGLASGVSAIIVTFFTAVAIKRGDYAMVVLGATTVGTTLGFLVFNVKPAKVFMGDTGSLALGAAIAAIAILMKMPMYLLLVALIPVLETLSTALQVIYFKATKGKRLFKMAPLHHHLELSGLKETTIVILFWGITAVLSLIGFILV